jgi:GxxExxY protein
MQMSPDVHRVSADCADFMNSDFPYKELTYQIRGTLFQIQNDLGTKFQEKHYQKGAAALFEKSHLPFQREVPFEIIYQETKSGNGRLDFVVGRVIGLEFKTVDRLTAEHRQQAIRYAESLHLPVVLIANFRIRPLQIIRVINSKYLRNPRREAHLRK